MVSLRSTRRLAATLATLALAASTAAACGDDEEEVGIDGFVLPEPEHTVYDDTKLPRGELPAAEPQDLTLADSLTPPLQQMGEDTGEEGIFYSAVLGGYYIMRVQLERGRFGYQYNITEGTWADDESIHRQAGSTYTQSWLAEKTQRLDFSLSTEWAIRDLTAEARPQDDGSTILTDLGATALILLSLTTHHKHLGDTSRDALIISLGDYILASIDSDGRFNRGGSLQWSQAVQALWKLYDYTGDERYLDALESAARWFYDHPGEMGEADAGYLIGLWVNEPLTDLYTIRPNAWISEYVFRIADPIAAQQYTAENTSVPEYVGSYIYPESGNKPSWRTALRLEAVVDALRLALLVGDQEHIERYRESTLLAVHYLMGIQLRKDRTRDAVDPDLVVGAFPFSGTDGTLRIDVTHHTVQVLGKAVVYLELEDYPAKPGDE